MGRFTKTRRIFLLAVLLSLTAGRLPAETPTLRIPRVSQPPALDDFLNGTPRSAEVKVTDFRQREPGDGVPVTQETAVYLSYDDHNLYVIFLCKDEPDKVRARLAKREAIGGDDFVGVILDTFHDRRRAYLFLTNPLGIQLDGITTEGQDDDYSFDTLWHSEGRLTPEGFAVRLAIPFKSLRFTNAPVQTWGIALIRVISRNNETAFWPFISRRVEGFTQQCATLEGLEHISPGRNLQFIPYGVFTRSHFLDTDAKTFRSETDARPGLDAKIVLRDALTLDIALNPDFSQVESDEPQVTVNQRFEVFFPERRPFFIENAGFFQTPENFFFSRRIVDPKVGVRLTGKLGRWAIGGIAIDDAAPGQRVPDNDPRHGRHAGIGVVRVQREFAGQSNIGALVTHREFAGGSTSVMALDTRIKLNANWIFSGQLSRGNTQEIEGRRYSGPAYFAEFRHSGKHLFYSGRYVDRSPTFRSSDSSAQLGFIPRVDIRQTEHFGNYLWRSESGPVRRIGPIANALLNWDRQGRLQDWQASPGFLVEFAGPTFVYIERGERFELFKDLGFRKHINRVEASTSRLKWLEISLSYGGGAAVNYSPAPGLPPFLGESSDSRFGVTLRPTSQLRIDETYIYSRLGLRVGSTLLGMPAAAASVFNNHILRTKVNYQFTRALSLRAIVDYNAVLPNPSLADLERSKRFSGDVLLAYLLHPGTAFYIGYTDRYENLAIDPTTPSTLRRLGSPFSSTGRQFFVKLSYLFRF